MGDLSPAVTRKIEHPDSCAFSLNKGKGEGGDMKIINKIFKNEETGSDFLNNFFHLDNSIFRKLNFHDHDLH